MSHDEFWPGLWWLYWDKFLEKQREADMYIYYTILLML